MDNSEDWFIKYDQKLWRELESKAEGAGHGGMDYMLTYDFIEKVRNKRPTPLDAYDAAIWSAISNLLEMSVSKGGAPVDFPDFTRDGLSADQDLPLMTSFRLFNNNCSDLQEKGQLGKILIIVLFNIRRV